LEYYANLNPNIGFTWPTAGPGDNEGANLNAMMNWFIFGNESIVSPPYPPGGDDPNIPSESDRVNLVAGTAGTAAANWATGKIQRGALDPVSGGFSSNAWQAAREAFAVTPNLVGTDGLSWGAWLPGPTPTGSQCGGSGPPEVTYVFTNINTHATASYSSCGYYLGYTDFTFILVPVGGGSPIVYDTNEWVEGPYTGVANLTKAVGRQVGRFIASFIKDFRGMPPLSPTIPTDQTKVFDWEDFLNSQYLLAPHWAHTVSSVLTAVYPNYQSTGPQGVDASMVLTNTASAGTTSYTLHSGFCLAMVFITGSGLGANQAVAFNLMNGVSLIQAVAVVADGSGNIAGVMVRIPSAPAAPVLGIVVATAIGSGAMVNVECAELMVYKPWEVDAYALLRIASSRPSGPPGGDLDGSGLETADASGIATSYFNNGCILGQGLIDEVSQGTVNTNGVYESWRDLTRCVRCATRSLLVGYEFDGTNSILWFKRFALGDSMADVFDGIGPSLSAVTYIRPGITYVATGGTVIYPPIGQPGSASHTSGTEFAGVFGQTAIDGTSTGQAFETEGIIRGDWGNGTTVNDAPINGRTNQWLMFPQFSPYNWSNSQAYDQPFFDGYPMPERCFMYAQQAGTGSISPAMASQLDQPDFQAVTPLIFPEAPTSMRYADGANLGYALNHQNSAQLAQYQSCQIYEPPAQMTSCVNDPVATAAAGMPVVKCTFKGRLRAAVAGEYSAVAACADGSPSALAPATVPAGFAWDVSAWTGAASLTNLQTEASAYRTVENGIREYIVWLATGSSGGGIGNTGDCTRAIGDDYAASQGVTESNNMGVNGGCFAHFYFVKEIPLVYEDGNDLQNPTDAPITADDPMQCDLYIRALCEGFVDGLTTATLVCGNEVPQLYCYTFENLCNQAFGLTSFGSASAAKRPDKPIGHGPMPGTIMSGGGSCGSEMFNRFAAAVNFLTMAPVYLPHGIQCQTVDYSAFAPLSPAWYGGASAYGAADGSCAGLSSTPQEIGYVAINAAQPAAAPPAPDPSAWATCNSFLQASSGSGIATGCYDSSGNPVGVGDPGHWEIVSNPQVTYYQLGLADPCAYYAIPSSWRDMVGTTSYGWFAQITVYQSVGTLLQVYSPAETMSTCGTPPSLNLPWNGTSGWTGAIPYGADPPSTNNPVKIVADNLTYCIQLPASGVLDAMNPPAGPAPGPSDFLLVLPTAGAGVCAVESENTVTANIIGGTSLGGTAFLNVPLV
jgi:hypothetical protein